MITKVSWREVASFALFACASVTNVWAALPLEKLTIGWSAVAGSQAPFWITKEAGLFEKNGLDVIMIYLDGGSRTRVDLLTGYTRNARQRF